MSQKPYHSKNLDDIRKKIDSLDTKIHETLMERAELVLQIGEEKRKNNIEIVQPAREARMIRRLLARHRGKLPEMAVVRIWRELVGAVSLLQTGLKVIVAEEESNLAYWDLAKDYFGSCLPMTRTESPFSAIKAVQEGRATFAVLPYPQGITLETDEERWWELLTKNEDSPLSIIVRLPHGEDPEEKNPDDKALVVSKTGFDSSDDDHSYLFVECLSSVSRARIIDVMKENDIEPLALTSKPDTGETRHHLLEVEGYIRDDSEKIDAIAEGLGENSIVRCVGGYPVPPTYVKTVQSPGEKIPKAPKAD
ncbi:MAG: chorismate mutase [Pseudomonadota bacterium]